MTLRIFLDASVLFSAAYSSSGFARDLLASGYRRDVILSVSRDVVEEVTRNLSGKKPHALTTLRGFVASGSLTVVAPDPSVVHQCAEIVEPKDAHVVAAAIAAEASMLVTYDRKHLLSRADDIQRLFDITVMTPEEILRTLPSLD